MKLYLNVPKLIIFAIHKLIFTSLFAILHGYVK